MIATQYGCYRYGMIDFDILRTICRTAHKLPFNLQIRYNACLIIYQLQLNFIQPIIFNIRRYINIGTDCYERVLSNDFSLIRRNRNLINHRQYIVVLSRISSDLNQQGIGFRCRPVFCCQLQGIKPLGGETGRRLQGGRIRRKCYRAVIRINRPQRRRRPLRIHDKGLIQRQGLAAHNPPVRPGLHIRLMRTESKRINPDRYGIGGNIIGDRIGIINRGRHFKFIDTRYI